MPTSISVSSEKVKSFDAGGAVDVDVGAGRVVDDVVWRGCRGWDIGSALDSGGARVLTGTDGEDDDIKSMMSGMFGCLFVPVGL